jgi:hypothetical protein
MVLHYDFEGGGSSGERGKREQAKLGKKMVHWSPLTKLTKIGDPIHP